MSLIDDIVGKKLPTGNKFQAKVGSSNLQRKLYSATRSGALKNLSDNQDIINSIASKRQSYIRSGKYTRDMREADFSEALRSGNLSDDDKKDLAAILEHWGRGEQKDIEDTKVSQPSRAEKRAEEAKKMFDPPPERDLPDFLQNRGSVSVNKSPWSDADRGGLGGGISSGANQGAGFRKPTLLK